MYLYSAKPIPRPQAFWNNIFDILWLPWWPQWTRKRRPRYQIKAHGTNLHRIWIQMIIVSLVLPKIPRWKPFSIILKYFLKHLQIMATLFEKMKLFFCDILGDRLVKVSWGVTKKTCFNFQEKCCFFSTKKCQVLKNASYLHPDEK